MKKRGGEYRGTLKARINKLYGGDVTCAKVKKLKSRKYKGVVGVNIGANKSSDGQQRINDYILCFNKVAQYSDYVTINISSPNTEGLRDFHNQKELEKLLKGISKIKKDKNITYNINNNI